MHDPTFLRDIHRELSSGPEHDLTDRIVRVVKNAVGLDELLPDEGDALRYIKETLEAELVWDVFFEKLDFADLLDQASQIDPAHVLDWVKNKCPEELLKEKNLLICE